MTTFEVIAVIAVVALYIDGRDQRHRILTVYNR